MLKYFQGWVIKENIRVVLHLIEKKKKGEVNLNKHGPSHVAGLTEGIWERTLQGRTCNSFKTACQCPVAILLRF